ncbi:MAG: outer membrane lipoprotein carrier protein LolA [candidate division Zixibacteria bacterium]|nr:outer membrane lipoprotein carrier protein LolA [candidate division Zixibacteria bacterium]
MPGNAIRIVALTLLVGLAGGGVRADTFDAIKQAYRKAACVKINFISIIESSVFETVDSVAGSAVIAGSGKYKVVLGKDKYLFDGVDLYSYSHDNNQVVIERLDPDDRFGAEVSFITRLDEIYKTAILRPDSTYRLVKSTSGYDNVPDSLVVTIDRRKSAIRTIEYFDVNEEKNRIVFREQSLTGGCDSTVFVPEFPDSAERMRLK